MEVKHEMAKEMKEIATAGLVAILANPLLLVILLVIGLIVLAIGVGIIIYYGLVTAIILFVLTLGGLLLLHYFKAIDLQKMPLLAVLPFIMAGIGYVCERLRILSIQPLWTTTPQTPQPSLTLEPADIQILLIIAAALIIAYLISRRK
jgi:hypothetical protein